jgi:putative heme-binding domain-containing protein
LATFLQTRWQLDRDNAALLRLACRTGDPAAVGWLEARCRDRSLPAADRVSLMAVLGDVAPERAAPMLTALVGGGEPDAVPVAALAAWQRVGSDAQAAELLAAYPRVSPAVKAKLRAVLLGKRAWAAVLLGAVDAGRIPAAEFVLDELRGVADHRTGKLDDLVRKHWGNIAPATPEEKLAEVRRLNNDLRAGPGDAKNGKALFAKHCATCHRLFSDGGAVGPDLTHANRADRQYLLVSLVDPGGMVRREYLSYRVETRDGRVLTGLIADQTPAAVTLLDAKNERTTVPRGEIESLHESPTSLMPDNLHKGLTPQELRDLFAYLQW